MIMRRWVYSRLIGDPLVQSQFGSKIFSSGGVGEDDNEVPPFIIIRAGIEQVGLRKTGVSMQPFYIYVHGERRSPAAVDGGIALVEEAMRLNEPQEFLGGIIMESRWMEASEDLYDDGFKTAVRFVTYQVTAAVGKVR